MFTDFWNAYSPEKLSSKYMQIIPPEINKKDGFILSYFGPCPNGSSC